MMDGEQARFLTRSTYAASFIWSCRRCRQWKAANKLSSSRDPDKIPLWAPEIIRLDSIARQVQEARGLLGGASCHWGNCPQAWGALAPDFHKSHPSGSEPRLKPSLTSDCFFHLRVEETYGGCAAAREPETLVLEFIPRY